MLQLLVLSTSPALGEHNDAVYLGLLGLERARYDALRAARVI